MGGEGGVFEMEGVGGWFCFLFLQGTNFNFNSKVTDDISLFCSSAYNLLLLIFLKAKGNFVALI